VCWVQHVDDDKISHMERRLRGFAKLIANSLNTDATLYLCLQKNYLHNNDETIQDLAQLT
jgi:hypothetical protein